jgi:hypothetical protein
MANQTGGSWQADSLIEEISTERAQEFYLEHHDPEINQVMESKDRENSSSLTIVIGVAVVVLVFLLWIFVL